jgi:hypothetical protein
MTAATHCAGQGLRIHGYALRWGELPPAAGPARISYCLQQGWEAFGKAQKHYGTAMRGVITRLPNGGHGLPPFYPLHELHDEETALAIGRQRVESWFALHKRIHARDRRMRKEIGVGFLGTQWDEVEKHSRAALGKAAEAFNWFDDARQDLGDETLIGIADSVDGSVDSRSVGSLVDASHALVHATGELVGGLFGCKMAYENGRWFDECIVALLHLRFGNSAGLNTRYECSVCHLDVGEGCGHEPGESYSVEATRTETGECTICDKQDCTIHIPGEVSEIVAQYQFADVDIREISLTPRPRDPLARITGRSVDDERFIRQMGRLPLEGELVLDHACMYPCRGFRDFPEG